LFALRVAAVPGRESGNVRDRHGTCEQTTERVMNVLISCSTWLRTRVTVGAVGVALLPLVLVVGVLFVRGAPCTPDPNALYTAASSDDLEAFRAALARLPSINTRDHLDYTPLAAAADLGRRDAVALLLEAGADVDAGHPQLGTPLMLALRNGHAGIARDLLEHGADVHVLCYGFDPLASAVRMDNSECLQVVLAAGADPRATGRRYNVLALAVGDSDVEILRRLLAAGADPNRPDVDGATPLVDAVECDAVESARLLLLAGADSARAGPGGRTPRSVAQQRNCEGMLKLLDDHEAAAASDGPARSGAPVAIAGSSQADGD